MTEINQEDPLALVRRAAHLVAGSLAKEIAANGLSPITNASAIAVKKLNDAAHAIECVNHADGGFCYGPLPS